MTRTENVLCIQPFPPPVTGMAVVAEAVTNHLSGGANVRRVSVAAPGLVRTPFYHLARFGRVAYASWTLLAERRRTRLVFLAANAGLGMYYTFGHVAIARALGYRIVLQHHCYNYLSSRHRVMALTTKIMRGAGTHLVSCERMKRDFEAVYSGTDVEVLSVAFAIDYSGGVPAVIGIRSTLVLGMLGNLTRDKGLERALNLLRAAVEIGLDVRLELAGPVPAPDDRDYLAQATRELGARVEHIGPVYGAARDAFLESLDVMLFPSLYVNESFGLVAWEAMVRGLPVMAYEAGCLTTSAVGDGGLVLDPSADFSTAALPTLARWSVDRDSLRYAGRAASEIARKEIFRGNESMAVVTSTVLKGPVRP